MQLFFEYSLADNSEREDIIFNAVIEYEMDKCIYELEKAILEHKTNLRNIDLILLTESSTIEDAERLYLEEEEKSNVKQDGIIGSLFKLLKKIINKANKILFGDKELQEEDFPEKAELKGDPEKIGDALKSNMNEFGTAIKSNDKSKLEAFYQKIKKHPILTGIIGATAMTVGKKKLKEYHAKIRETNHQLDGDLTEYEKYMLDHPDEEVRGLVGKCIQEFRKSLAMGEDVFKSVIRKDKFNDVSKDSKEDHEHKTQISDEEIAKRKNENKKLDKEIANLEKQISQLEQQKKHGKSDDKDSSKMSLSERISKGLKNITNARDRSVLEELYKKEKREGRLEGSDKKLYEQLKTRYGAEFFDTKGSLERLKAKKERLEEQRSENYKLIDAYNHSVVKRDDAKFNKERHSRMSNPEVNGKKNKNKKDEKSENDT